MRSDSLVQTGPVPSKIPSAWHFWVKSPLAWVYPSAHVYSTSVLKSTYSSDELLIAWHTVVRHCTTVNTFNWVSLLFFSFPITFSERFILDVRYFLIGGIKKSKDLGNTFEPSRKKTNTVVSEQV